MCTAWELAALTDPSMIYYQGDYDDNMLNVS